jgi:hypothetical protein
MCNARVEDTHNRANALGVPHKRIRGQILFYRTSRARRLHDDEFVAVDDVSQRQQSSFKTMATIKAKAMLLIGN